MHSINLDYLQEITGGDSEIMVEMIDLFLQETPKHLDLMEEHLEKESWLSLAAETHKLKPTLLYVGLQDLHEAAIKLEADSRNKENLGELPELLAELQNGYIKVKEGLEAKRKELLS